MMFDGPIELLEEAERKGYIKICHQPDSVIPFLDVFNPQKFTIFLLDVAIKTDCEVERRFCLSNLKSLQEEEERRSEEESECCKKTDKFIHGLKKCQTVDDVLKIM